jgi:hypothetical protein
MRYDVDCFKLFKQENEWKRAKRSRREEKGKEQTKVVLCDEKKNIKCPALLIWLSSHPRLVGKL